MKAVIFNEYGESNVLHLTEVAKPTPQPTEVLIKLEFSGVNFVDTYVRTGLYPAQFPCTTGREGAGIIDALGSEVEPGLNIGDRVAVFAPGSMAEYMTAPGAKVLKLPPKVSTKEGAGIMLQGLTAWTLVRDAHDLKAGEIALVQAAAGGTGGLVVQMAKALGATVIGSVSSCEKAKVAKGHGCDHVIIYTEQNIEEEVMRLTDGKGCHAVFSGVGKGTVRADMNMTRRKGTFVTYGNSSGAIDAIKPLDLSKKNIKLVRPTLANYITDQKEFDTRSQELLHMVERGTVRVNFGAEYTLDQVAKAQDDLVSGKTVGKLIVRI